MPNADFVPDEHASLNFDVKMCGTPSILHYLRDGIREGRPISSLDIQETTFPPNAVELRREFSMADINHR